MPSLSKLLALVPALYLVLVAVPLTVIDLREHRLPNRIVLPVFPLALLFQVIATILSSDWAAILFSLGLALLVFLAGLLANYFDWLGMGDVKLAAGLSLVLGYFSPWLVLVALTASFALAFVIVIIRVIAGRISMNSSIPLGPYLLFSFMVALGSQAFSS